MYLTLLRFQVTGGALGPATPSLCTVGAGPLAPQRWPQGVAAYVRGDLTDAEPLLTAALMTMSADERTLRLDQALSYAPLIWHDHPESVDFMVEYARQHGHTSPIGYMRLALFYLHPGDLTTAKAVQERLHTTLTLAAGTTLTGYQPRANRTAAHYYLGEYYRVRDARLAVQAYQAAVDEDPKDTTQSFAWMSAMKVVEYSIQSQDWQRAYAMLGYAEALPDRYHRYSYTRLRRAQIDAERGEDVRAIAVLEETILRDPQFVATRLYLATLYTTAGRLQQAAEQYQAVLRIEPDNQEAQRALTELRSP
jgi:tetratricopeptide (TPR) repeat protein